MENREKEIKEAIKKYQEVLSDCHDFTAQTWLKLSIRELKKELKALKKSKPNSKEEDKRSVARDFE